jgi:type II secretion system protein I
MIFNKKTTGFTLIEILIALVIIAISFTAIMKVTSDNINGHQYLNNKMMAHWAAENTLNKYKLGLLPDMENRENILNATFICKIQLQNQTHEKIKKIYITVLDEKKHSLDSLESYVLQETQTED